MCYTSIQRSIAANARIRLIELRFLRICSINQICHTVPQQCCNRMYLNNLIYVVQLNRNAQFTGHCCQSISGSLRTAKKGSTAPSDTNSAIPLASITIRRQPSWVRRLRLRWLQSPIKRLRVLCEAVSLTGGEDIFDNLLVSAYS